MTTGDIHKLATEVMGWTGRNEETYWPCREWTWRNADGYEVARDWRPDENIVDAMDLLAKMLESDRFSIFCTKGWYTVRPVADFTLGEAETLPLAICRAALKWLDSKEPSNT